MIQQNKHTHGTPLPTPRKIRVKWKLLDLVNGLQERQELNIKEVKQRRGRRGREHLLEGEERG